MVSYYIIAIYSWVFNWIFFFSYIPSRLTSVVFQRRDHVSPLYAHRLYGSVTENTMMCESFGSENIPFLPIKIQILQIFNFRNSSSAL